VPGFVRNKFFQSQMHHDDFGKCIICERIKYEIDAGERVVVLNDSFVAISPYASVVPYHVIIYPLGHQSSFSEAKDGQLKDFSHVLQTVLKKLNNLLDDPDYNYVIDSSPADEAGNSYYHWRLEILPRLSTRAGFEIGTGININSIFPEECSKRLREQEI